MRASSNSGQLLSRRVTPALSSMLVAAIALGPSGCSLSQPAKRAANEPPPERELARFDRSRVLKEAYAPTGRPADSLTSRQAGKPALGLADSPTNSGGIRVGSLAEVERLQ